MTVLDPFYGNTHQLFLVTTGTGNSIPLSALMNLRALLAATTDNAAFSMIQHSEKGFVANFLTMNS